MSLRRASTRLLAGQTTSIPTTQPRAGRRPGDGRARSARSAPSVAASLPAPTALRSARAPPQATSLRRDTDPLKTVPLVLASQTNAVQRAMAELPSFARLGVFDLQHERRSRRGQCAAAAAAAARRRERRRGAEITKNPKQRGQRSRESKGSAGGGAVAERGRGERRVRSCPPKESQFSTWAKTWALGLRAAFSRGLEIHNAAKSEDGWSGRRENMF